MLLRFKSNFRLLIYIKDEFYTTYWSGYQEVEIRPEIVLAKLWIQYELYGT
jgi:hypothetical protein